MKTINDLVKRWRKESDDYQRQVDEARKAGTPHDQMLAMVTCLRTCAKELETALHAERFRFPQV